MNVIDNGKAYNIIRSLITTDRPTDITCSGAASAKQARLERGTQTSTQSECSLITSN